MYGLLALAGNVGIIAAACAVDPGRPENRP